MENYMQDMEQMDFASEKKPVFIPMWDRYQEEWALLNDQEVGELIRAMLAYANDKSKDSPALEGAGRYFWVRVKADIDYAAASYEKKVAAGKKGGRPRKTPKAEDAVPTEEICSEAVPTAGKEKAEKTKKNQKKAEESKNNLEKANETKEKQEKVIHKQNQNQKQNQNHNQDHNHNHNQDHNQNHPQNQAQGQNQPHPWAQEADAKPEEEKAGFSLGNAVVDCFYLERKDLERPPAVSKRLLSMAADLEKTYSMEVIRSVFRKTGEGFLSGDNPSGWTATLPWILEPENFQKVMDGRYFQGQKTRSTPSGNALEYARRMTERMEQGTAGLGHWEKESIRRMLAEQRQRQAAEPHLNG